MIKRILMVLMVPSLSALVLWTGCLCIGIVCLLLMYLAWELSKDD